MTKEELLKDMGILRVYNTENLRSYPEKMRCASEIKAHIEHFKKGECNISCPNHPYQLIEDGICTINDWIKKFETELEMCLPDELEELHREIDKFFIFSRKEKGFEKLILKLHKKEQEKHWPILIKKWFVVQRKSMASNMNNNICSKISKLEDKKKKLQKKIDNYRDLYEKSRSAYRSIYDKIEDAST